MAEIGNGAVGTGSRNELGLSATAGGGVEIAPGGAVDGMDRTGNEFWVGGSLGTGVPAGGGCFSDMVIYLLRKLLSE